MKITKRIYEQACIALDFGYTNVIISKNKREFKNNQAKGNSFEIHTLTRLKWLYEEKKRDFSRGIQIDYCHSRGRRLGPFETIKLNSVNIKFSDMMKLKREDENLIPSLIYYSTDLKLAREKNWWFYDVLREPHFIFVNWDKFPGIITHHVKNKKFFYEENNFLIETNDLNILRNFLRRKFRIYNYHKKT